MSSSLRKPLEESSLRGPNRLGKTFWQSLKVVEITDSTQQDMIQAAREGAPAARALIAESQLAGKGRRGRTWEAPAYSSLMLSIMVRPEQRVERWGSLTLLAAVCVAEALREYAHVEATIKWPNDVLVNGKKISGILATVEGDAVVLGMGINVSTTDDELPIAEATSVLLEGGRCDRLLLLEDLLYRFENYYGTWNSDSPDRVLEFWRNYSSTLGQEVRIEQLGGKIIEGTAVDIDHTGALIVRDGNAQLHHITAAETVHLRGQQGS